MPSKYAAEYVLSKKGNKMLFLDGYTFTHTNDVRRRPTSKIRWTCSNRARYGCKAKVFTVNNWIVNAEYVTSKRGKKMLFLNGYTFTQANDLRWNPKTLRMRWTCSTRARYGCKAKVFTVEDWIVNGTTSHNHPRPKRPENM